MLIDKPRNKRRLNNKRQPNNINQRKRNEKRVPLPGRRKSSMSGGEDEMNIFNSLGLFDGERGEG